MDATEAPRKPKEEAPKMGSSDVKNRGWPKGKKRYPKSPGAPKQPLSGYVHFLNDRRETVRKESPDMSFADISKKLANEWSQLPQEEKQKYVERAELDKERYNREFQDYQQTDEYKEFVAQQEAAKRANGEANKGPPSAKKPKKSKKKENNEQPLVNEDSRSSNSSMDIPIFREEFLELNKAREAELRSLRKTVSEFEEQNAVLQKHVDNMRSAVTKLERDVSLIKDNNEALEGQYEIMKKVVIANFAKIQVPNLPTLTNDNVEEFVTKLLELAHENPLMKEAVKKAGANIDMAAFNSAPPASV